LIVQGLAIEDCGCPLELEPVINPEQQKPTGLIVKRQYISGYARPRG
jgi:hypothetical protein